MTNIKSSKHKWGLILIALAVGAIVIKAIYPDILEWYTGVANAPLTYESSARLDEKTFNKVVNKLSREVSVQTITRLLADEKDPFARRIKFNMRQDLRSNSAAELFPHVKYFRNAGIDKYEGPATCLKCHETMTRVDAEGRHKEVNTLEDVVNTVHFKFQSNTDGFTTYGYDGRLVNGPGTRPIPLGKINRGCGLPGSFSWTGWAKLVKTKPHGKDEVEIRSEGCGQCHIGGNYHPATEKMLPLHDVAKTAKQGIDCLICHSQFYDMNQRYVIEDKHGMRWNQDRSLAAALTVAKPTTRNCLFCHQHNLGGDVETVADARNSVNRRGDKHQRILHVGAKRGNSFQPDEDVHAAAGLTCTDCHVPEGHKVPRGVKGVDLVANDLPGKLVECETCHTAAPHVVSADRAILNGHVDRLACETCHITHLLDDNLVLRDWTHPVWDEHEGTYVYFNLLKSGKVNEGFKFFWSNGKGTFLANALGDNPTPGGEYNPLMDGMVRITDPGALARIRENVKKLKAHYPDLDEEAYIKQATNFLLPLSQEQLEARRRVLEDNLRPVMKMGKSRIYPFKLFNAVMYEDMLNQGPFGAMILPFDYPAYYETGNSLAAMKKAMEHPIMKRMYQQPFKLYMMDEFMKYFGVGEWKPDFPVKPDGSAPDVKANWMRQMGTLLINHGIKKQGHSCEQCHAENGIMHFEELGYPPERVKDLQELLNKPMRRAEVNTGGIEKGGTLNP